MDCYEQLANAIVLQAVKDYRHAFTILKKHPHNTEALYKKQEVEHFFRSGWYTSLTTVEPEILIRKLKEEVKE